MENKTESAGSEQTPASLGASLPTPPGPLKSDNPALRLLDTLDSLRMVCSTAGLFHRVDAHRNRVRNDHTRMMVNAMQLGLVEVNPDNLSRRTDAVTQGCLETAREILDKGFGWHIRAREAVKAGGGDCVDTMLNPGAKGWSIDLGVKLREAERVFNMLKNGLSWPDGAMGAYPQRMAELGEEFATARDELDDAIERGGGKPTTKAANPEPTDLIALNVAAELFDVSQNRIPAWIKKGLLPVYGTDQLPSEAECRQLRDGGRLPLRRRKRKATS